MKENRKIISGKGYEIFIDELDRIRITIDEGEEELLNKVTSLVAIVNKLDTLPMKVKERENYQKDIANIYQIGILSGEKLALEYSYELQKDIERNLVIRKKQVLFIPTIIGQLLLIILAVVLIKFNVLIIGGEILLFGTIGGVLSTLFYNNKLEIDYYVIDNLLYFEALKLILLPNIMAIIGFLVIKSGIVLGGNFENITDGQYLNYLVYVVCGYSQSFIPNILKNFEIKNSNNRNTN